MIVGSGAGIDGLTGAILAFVLVVAFLSVQVLQRNRKQSLARRVSAVAGAAE